MEAWVSGSARAALVRGPSKKTGPEGSEKTFLIDLNGEVDKNKPGMILDQLAWPDTHMFWGFNDVEYLSGSDVTLPEVICNLEIGIAADELARMLELLILKLEDVRNDPSSDEDRPLGVIADWVEQTVFTRHEASIVTRALVPLARLLLEVRAESGIDKLLADAFDYVSSQAASAPKEIRPACGKCLEMIEELKQMIKVTMTEALKLEQEAGVPFHNELMMLLHRAGLYADRNTPHRNPVRVDDVLMVLMQENGGYREAAPRVKSALGISAEGSPTPIEIGLVLSDQDSGTSRGDVTMMPLQNILQRWLKAAADRILACEDTPRVITLESFVGIVEELAPREDVLRRLIQTAALKPGMAAYK